MSSTTPAHLSSTTDNWPTPQSFFDVLNIEFGLVLDVCASTTNHKATSFYALDHPEKDRRDGLTADWAGDAIQLGGAIWMNPPYGRPIAAWMAKAHAAARAGATVVTLVPVRADTAWWHDHVLATGAEVRYVRGRLTFGDAVNTAAFASAVVIYRPTDVAGAPGTVSTMPARPTPASQERACVPVAESPGLEVQPHVPVRTPQKCQRVQVDCITSRRTLGPLVDMDGGDRTAYHFDGGSTVVGAQEYPAARRSRLDELTTFVAAAVHGSEDLGAASALSDPTACLDLVRATVARRGGIGRTYKSEAAVQHLFSTVWQYGLFFAPGRDWRLIDVEPGQATLRWQHWDGEVGGVVDVIAASGHPNVDALPKPDGSTVRLCNLANRPASLLWLPGSPAPQAWTPSADPVASTRMAVAA